MAIFTFSTKTRLPAEEEAIKRIKKHCEEHGLNFSALVVRLLIEWEQKQSQAKGDNK